MCTALSAWQHINISKRDPAVTFKEYARGLSHFRFYCELYEYQVAHARYFLHEHSSQVTSWCTDEAKRIMNLEEVDRSVAHQCQYGAQHEGHPIKKPTGFMSNSIEIRRALSKTCKGKRGQCSRSEGGDHILCNGRVARWAAIFQVRCCKAILSGFSSQLRRDGVTTPGVIGMHEAG